jgi:YggT family protein
MLRSLSKALMRAMGIGVNQKPAENLLLTAIMHRRKAGHQSEVEMQSVFQILMLLLDIAWFFIIAHVIMSWLINFQVLNVRQQLVGQIWYGLNRMLEPVYGKIRQVIPAMGGLDLAPLIALVGLMVIRIVLQNNAGFFYSF